MSDFSNKSVIVTGGAKGIGAGISRAFAAAGARVACVDVDATAGAALVAETADAKGEVRFFEADVSGGAACKEVCSRVIDEWDGIDVLCNNVGIQPVDSYVPAHELPDEMWDRIVDINLKSYFLMAKYSVPDMMERGGGVIINTASVQGLQSALGVSVDELVEAQGMDRAEFDKGYAELHPVGRFGQPVDIAHAVLFLAGEGASFMTGSYVNVDGGLMAKGAWA